MVVGENKFDMCLDFNGVGKMMLVMFLMWVFMG